MLHGYTPTPATMLKLQLLQFDGVFTVVAKEKHGELTSVQSLKLLS
jgi:hypothetical protein